MFQQPKIRVHDDSKRPWLDGDLAQPEIIELLTYRGLEIDKFRKTQYIDMGIGHEGTKNLPNMAEMGSCYCFVSAS